MPILNGAEALIKFDNISEAESFRFACYSLRRRKKIGIGLSFILEQHESKPCILIKRTPTFEIKRVS
jgi:hypothetical protein